MDNLCVIASAEQVAGPACGYLIRRPVTYVQLMLGTG